MITFAYLIDPKSKAVTRVDFDGSMPKLYELLECSMFEMVALPAGDCMCLDEEGLLHGPFHAFSLIGRLDQRFAGRGLVVGSTRDGEFADPRVTMGVLADNIHWHDTRFTATIRTVEKTINHQIFGEMQSFTNVPVYSEYRDDQDSDDSPDPIDNPASH